MSTPAKPKHFAFSLAFALTFRAWAGEHSKAAAMRLLNCNAETLARCAAGYRPYNTGTLSCWPVALRPAAFRWQGVQTPYHTVVKKPVLFPPPVPAFRQLTLNLEGAA